MMERYDHRGRVPEPSEPVVNSSTPGVVHRQKRQTAAPDPTPSRSDRLRNFPGQKLINGKLLLPVLLVLGTLFGAFLIQPSGAPQPAQAGAELSVAPPIATTSPTVAVPTPTAEAEQAVMSDDPDAAMATEADGSATESSESGAMNEVAGVQDEPEPTATPDFSAAARCGSIQETIVEVSVAQTLHDIAVHVTSVAVYPIEYFICILDETGGAEADALSAKLDEAFLRGSTHAIVADIWVTNSGRDFGQLNMNRAGFTVAGLTNYPLAVLGSTIEVLITAGQGRGLTLVAAVTNSVGSTTGPVTLTFDPPLVGGEETTGKYQLFLPTP